MYVFIDIKRQANGNQTYFANKMLHNCCKKLKTKYEDYLKLSINSEFSVKSLSSYDFIQ